MGSFVVSPPIERRHPVADRRKTKPSDREAEARLGDHDPPTPRDRAERSREREMSGLAASSSFIQDFGHCSSPRTASPMPQPYGTPAPWPNGDGTLSELGPNAGIRMKAVTL